MPEPEAFPHPTSDASPLEEATARLVRSVDAMDDDAWRAPSLLPGWSRAHVVAHLALNAEALADVVGLAARDEPAAMYASPEQRDADIDELAGAAVTDLRERFLASTTTYADAVASLPDDGWRGTFDRTPGLLPRPMVGIPTMRLREVELHHVDLGLGATPASWPEAFTVDLVEAMVGRRPTAAPLRLEATDRGGTWELGGDDPAGAGRPTVVRGTTAGLGWWLSGRPAVPGTAGPTTDDGDLPGIEGL
ncbi:maleylpyruvate isomerase family mycothiol-dependent enzyme [Nocardioides abyssi]|uniref:Maleylpyruvate isomerase family mycothiol-dependent enzyme n=1 Tax=Nocardioides abyssi TaxID=3058370 RepID=A0ABT8EVG4_9ACTN|nr:maleylpyruvate isomerase family mycothiol-dependent enzyme [Nocardioides abyssi]MDN4162163.1 maleylpyruvate isomerase family mycothiol-dependent enzyme [Nocardioides abyssi]